MIWNVQRPSKLPVVMKIKITVLKSQKLWYYTIHLPTAIPGKAIWGLHKQYHGFLRRYNVFLMFKHM